ncbi:MAG: hypothetical protein LBT93_02945 [Treponema sp.]|jgi:hypothetical protein|nr:hypothetical protein [Treponema sp.]
MKKKLILVWFCFLVVPALVFAENAKLLPGRVGRIYAVPAFAFVKAGFDRDGEYQKYADEGGALWALNLGFAAEYGILDWLTAALQWAPGWTFRSDVDAAVDKVNVNGLADIFAGMKLQLIGEGAPLKTGRFRLALAPGVKIPLPGPNFKEEAQKVAAGKAVSAGNQDKHVLGAGGRGYFDCIFNEYFFINLYGEFIYYPMRGKLENSGLDGYEIAAGINTLNNSIKLQDPSLGNAIKSGGVHYGYDLAFEVEPVFTLPLAKGVSFTAGLPFNYKLTPGKRYHLTVNHTGNSGLDTEIDLAAASIRAQLNEGSTSLLSLKPNASLFFTDLKLPMEFELCYSVPIWGKNEGAAHSLSFRAKLYFRI